MPLHDADYRLSMAVSRRSADEHNKSLRTLMLHRLRDRLKAVLRLPLAVNAGDPSRYGVYCEGCEHWTYTAVAAADFSCPRCDRHYVVECVIYTEADKPQNIA
jgi:hypothetical protein